MGQGYLFSYYSEFVFSDCLIFDHLLSDTISIFSSGKYVALEWSEICLYEFAIFLLSTIKRAFHAGGQYWDYYSGSLSLKSSHCTHLKIGHP